MRHYSIITFWNDGMQRNEVVNHIVSCTVEPWYALERCIMHEKLKRGLEWKHIDGKSLVSEFTLSEPTAKLASVIPVINTW